MITAVVTPRKCGYRHDPPRLVLFYEKGGKPRQRTMPLRKADTEDSVSVAVDRLLDRHGDYLSAVPKQQLLNLVRRLLHTSGEPSSGSDSDSPERGRRRDCAKPAQASSAKDDRDQAASDDDGDGSEPGTPPSKPPLPPSTADSLLRRVDKNAGSSPPGSERSSILSDLSSELSDKLPDKPAGDESDDDDSNPFAKSPAPSFESGGLHSPSTLADNHEAADSDSQRSLSAAREPDAELSTDGESPQRLRPKAKASVRFDEAEVQVIEISRDNSTADLSQGLADAGSARSGFESEERSPPPSPMSQDTAADSLLSPRRDADSPVRGHPAERIPSPLTSTPQKGSLAPLSSLPSLLGLSPLGTTTAFTVTAAGGADKKKGKKKKAEAGKKKKNKKKNTEDALLGLLDDDDDDEEEMKEDKGDTGAADSSSQAAGGGAARPGKPAAPGISAKSSLFAASADSSPASNMLPGSQPSPPAAAATEDMHKSSAKPSGENILSDLRAKHPLSRVNAPSLSSSDSEVDSTGRFRKPPPDHGPSENSAPRQGTPSTLTKPLGSAACADDQTSSATTSLSSIGGELYPGSFIPISKERPPVLQPPVMPDSPPPNPRPQSPSGSEDGLSLGEEDLSLAADSEEDLNCVGADVLVAKKEEMSKGFESNRVKPGDPDFQYDIEEDFGDADDKQECGWDGGGSDNQEDDEW